MTEELAKRLKEKIPESTEAECFRFSQSAYSFYDYYRKDNKDELIEEMATQKLEEYLDWRNCYGIDYDKPPSNMDDEAVWEWAVQKALRAERAQQEAKKQLLEAEKAIKEENARREKLKLEPKMVDYDSHIHDAVKAEEGSDENDNGRDSSGARNDDNSEGKEDSENMKKTLPQIIFKRVDPETGEQIRNKNGDPIFHVLAGRIDRFAAQNETWSLATALYLDLHFDRQSKDLFCLFIDARAGEGWANPKFLMSVSLTRNIINTVSGLHPGRWNSLIIFPLPRALLGIWRTVKGFFHPDIARIINLVGGPSHLGSPLPRTYLEIYVDDDALEMLEKFRTELCTTGNNDE
jgi:hypothetical protein